MMLNELKMNLYYNGQLIGCGWFTTVKQAVTSEHGAHGTSRYPEWAHVFCWRRSPQIAWSYATQPPKFDSFEIVNEFPEYNLKINN